MARPRKNSEQDIVVARESGTMVIDGELIDFRRGVTRFRKSHKAVKANPQFFEPINVHYDVERATAAPGEKRTG